MFGFVRPAACRSSAPRSVTDGRPYPPLPRRAKKQKQDSTVFSQKTGNQRKWWERLPPSADSFHRPRGGPPPSMREVWGFAGQGLRPCRRLHIGALRSPLSPFAPTRRHLLVSPFPRLLSPRPPSSREGDRPQAVEGVPARSQRQEFPPAISTNRVPPPVKTSGLAVDCL